MMIMVSVLAGVSVGAWVTALNATMRANRLEYRIPAVTDALLRARRWSIMGGTASTVAAVLAVWALAATP